VCQVYYCHKKEFEYEKSFIDHDVVGFGEWLCAGPTQASGGRSDPFAVQLDQQNREAITAQWQKGLNMILRYAFFVMTAAVCFVIFMGARSIATSFATATEGISTALVRAAEVKANLIYLDERTRQYPVFLQYLGQGKFSLVNPNVNAVLMLDTRSEPDRQMIAAMGATQYAGALAREARQSDDPTGVSMIQAPIVDAKSEVISIGKDLVRHE
jgi:hypothetical protein